MKTWNWHQPNNRIWRVISDYKKGFIKVLDENGRLLMSQEGLTEEAIKTVEKNFLAIVAPSGNNVLVKTKSDPMYV